MMTWFKLLSVAEVNEASGGAATHFLFKLLAERDPVANISHKKMPSFEQHQHFVESAPYRAWYILFRDHEPIGATYLTDKNEIGIAILKSHQGNGYGKHAIRMLMDRHPSGRYLANIAPRNARSLAMFEGMGFELVQLTFAREKSE